MLKHVQVIIDGSDIFNITMLGETIQYRNNFVSITDYLDTVYIFNSDRIKFIQISKELEESK